MMKQMVREKVLKKILTVISVITMLAGMIVPANTTIMAATVDETIVVDSSNENNRVNFRIGALCNQRISSMTLLLTYDTSKMKYNSYRQREGLGNGLCSVNAESETIRVALANSNGFAPDGSYLVEFYFDSLTQESSYTDIQIEVEECVDVNLQTINIPTQRPTVYVEKITQRSYKASMHSNSDPVHVNDLCDCIISFEQNKGIYGGKFTITYDAKELEFQSVKADKIATGTIVSFNEEEKGTVNVAFACSQAFDKNANFLHLYFMPINATEMQKITVEDFTITDYRLEECEVDLSPCWFSISDIAKDNYFKITAPQGVKTEDSFDVVIELLQNSGFGAMTFDFLYDAELFDYVESNYEEGILSGCLTNVSKVEEGRIRIAAVSGKNITDSGNLLNIRLKAKAEKENVALLSIQMDEFIDENAKKVAFSVGTGRVKCLGACEHEYGEPEFVWDEQYASCIARFVCTKNEEHVLELECVVENKVEPPTCTQKGKTTHTASVEYQEKVYTDIIEIFQDPIDHALEHYPQKDQMREYWYCPECKKYFTDKNATTEIEYKNLVLENKNPESPNPGNQNLGNVGSDPSQNPPQQTVTKPKAPKMKAPSLKAKKKSFVVKWKKNTKVKGYQIQYSTSKKFKKGKKTITIKNKKTTSRTVKKLKAKKTYYVRMRTYITYKGKKIYGAWTKAKKITTKK